MFPSVLADYKPALPADVGWETISFMPRSKLGPEKRNRCFCHKHFKHRCDCDEEVLAGSAGVLLWDGWGCSAHGMDAQCNHAASAGGRGAMGALSQRA